MAGNISDSYQTPLVIEKRKRTQLNFLRGIASCLSAVKSICIEVILLPVQEALAASVLLWFLYVIISFCSYFLLLYTTEYEGRNSYIIADVLLIALIMIGIIVQAICLYRKSNTGFVRFGMLSDEHSKTYLMAGIYLFGIGTLFTILLRMLNYYHAYERIVNCQLYNITQMSVADIFKNRKENQAVTNSTKSLVIFGGYCYIDVVFDTARLLFTVLQLCFIQAFRTATFKSSNFVRFTLYHTLMTNGCIWIRYTIDETHLFKHATYRSYIDHFAVLAFEMEELMIPFILEYSLLAAGLLYSIASHMNKSGNTVAAHGSNTLVTRQDTTTDGDTTDRCDTVIPMTTEDIAQQMSHSSPGCQPGLIFGAFCGLLLLVSSLTFNTSETKFNRRSHNFFLIYEGFLAFLQIIVIFWILNLLRNHNKNAHKLRTEDTLLLLGYIGTFAFNWVSAYSVIDLLINSHQNRGSNILTAVHMMVLILSHSMQTILIIVSSRYTVRQEQMLSATKIRQFILFMLTTNLGFWALDSFVEMKNNARSSYPSGKIVFKGDWDTITSLAYPFLVFYRFHSAEMLYDFWSRYRVSAKVHYP